MRPTATTKYIARETTNSLTLTYKDVMEVCDALWELMKPEMNTAIVVIVATVAAAL